MLAMASKPPRSLAPVGSRCIAEAVPRVAGARPVEVPFREWFRGGLSTLTLRVRAGELGAEQQDLARVVDPQ